MSSRDGASETFASVRTYSNHASTPRPANVACIACTMRAESIAEEHPLADAATADVLDIDA